MRKSYKLTMLSALAAAMLAGCKGDPARSPFVMASATPSGGTTKVCVDTSGKVVDDANCQPRMVGAGGSYAGGHNDNNFLWYWLLANQNRPAYGGYVRGGYYEDERRAHSSGFVGVRPLPPTYAGSGGSFTGSHAGDAAAAGAAGYAAGRAGGFGSSARFFGGGGWS